MKILEIDVHKPDFQTLRAAVELLADDYVILFPADTGLCIVAKSTGELPKRVSAIVSSPQRMRLAISADTDPEKLAQSDITPYFPDYDANRAFYTLVQLCEFPLIVATTVPVDQQSAADAFPGVAYGFWPQ